uniref:Uncharacterized protein n=1 Tax=Anguilla anguilla TaxID=7936 RepID=A0A0E9WW10_ANGAN
MKEPAVPLILNMLIINAIISINISGLLADNQLKGKQIMYFPKVCQICFF